MERIITSKSPKKCPKCMCKKISLYDVHSTKSICDGNRDIVFLGKWMCENCGYEVGRKINRYENELDSNCIEE